MIGHELWALINWGDWYWYVIAALAIDNLVGIYRLDSDNSTVARRVRVLFVMGFVLAAGSWIPGLKVLGVLSLIPLLVGIRIMTQQVRRIGIIRGSIRPGDASQSVVSRIFKAMVDK